MIYLEIPEVGKCPEVVLMDISGHKMHANTV
jgi:hypothetical protein